MKEKIKCAVLVSSCDKYEDAWLPFFSLVKKYWKGMDYPFYLNTETKKVGEIAGVEITTVNCPEKNCSWSKRLIGALKKIPSKYVIFMLEDFFLMSKVEQNEIDRAISLMDLNKNIANVNFGYGKDILSDEYIADNYAKRSRKTSYYLNAQAAVWRKKALINVLSPYESAWQFELYGSERAKLYPYDFIIKKDDIPVFDYHTQLNFNLGIQKGMWMTGNVEFFEKEGIAVNFENLGMYSPEKVKKGYNAPPKRTLKEKLMRFLYAGENVERWEIKDQLKLLFSHPVRYAKEKVHAIRK